MQEFLWQVGLFLFWQNQKVAAAAADEAWPLPARERSENLVQMVLLLVFPPQYQDHLRSPVQPANLSHDQHEVEQCRQDRMLVALLILVHALLPPQQLWIFRLLFFVFVLVLVLFLVVCAR